MFDRTKRVSALVLGLFGSASSAVAQQAVRVADLNTTTWTDVRGGSCEFDRSYVVAEHPGFLFADPGGLDCEIFEVDAAQSLLTRVADLHEVGARVVEVYGAVDGILYFTADHEASGLGLWRTDGTQEGTFLIHDPTPGPAWSDDRISFHAAGSPWSYFSSMGPDGPGWRLWRTDGTRAGTIPIEGARPVARSDHQLGTTGGVLWNSLLFFVGSDDVNGMEIWRTDGTPEGTLRLTSFQGPDPLGSRLLTATIASGVLFTIRPEEEGSEIWRTDGTPSGTQLVWSSIGPGGGLYVPWLVANADRALFFSVGSEPPHAMWVTDGTGAGTEQVLTLPGAYFSEPSEPVAIGDGWFFFWNDATHSDEPWFTDGTVAGTRMVADFRPGPEPSRPYGSSERAARLGGRLVLLMNDGVHGDELWITDGSAAGTTLIADLTPGSGHTTTELLGEQDGFVLFRLGRQLWTTDGTAAGTSMIEDFTYVMTPSNPKQMTDAGSILYFDVQINPICDPDRGIRIRHPARSDGTETGTRLLTGDLPEWTCGSSAAFSVVPNGRVVAKARPPLLLEPTGGLMWSSEGDSISWLRATSSPHILEYIPPVAEGVVLFTSRDGATGYELWATDGTLGGTGLLLDLVPGQESSTPDYFQPVGDEIWFSTFDEDGLEQVWRTLGTPESTESIRVIPGELNQGVRSLVWPFHATSESFFFFAPGEFGWRMYFVPNALADPQLVLDGADGSSNWTLLRIGDVNGRLIFTTGLGKDPGVGRELWVSDGTPAGTRLLRDLWSGPASSDAKPGVTLGNRLFFRACDAEAGCEPWVTDGTTAGTRRLLDIEPGPFSSRPWGFSRVGDRICFAACQVGVGCEVWISDGSPEGTRRLPEIAEGPRSSVARTHAADQGFQIRPGGVPPAFVWFGGAVYFAGDDGTGAELWAIQLEIFRDGFESGDTDRWSASQPIGAPDPTT